MKAVGLMASIMALVLGISGNCLAQDKASPAPTGFRGDFLLQLADVENKFVGLADALPQEKYGWRPGEGVRSVSEVYMHIVGANYLFPSMAGVKTPEDVGRDMEKTVTEKPKVMEWLRKSFDHIRQAVMALPDADLGKPAKMFGQETTVQNVYFTAATHMHEHL